MAGDISSLSDRRRIEALEGEISALREEVGIHRARAAHQQADALRLLVDRLYDHDVVHLAISDLGHGHGYEVAVRTRGGEIRSATGVLLLCLDQVLPTMPPRGRAPHGGPRGR